MLTKDERERLHSAARGGDGGLTRFLATLDRRAAPLLARMPPVPSVKALLSRDGGWCPEDGSALLFDPWSPDRHRCPRCGREWSGERHHRHWARAQHLWLAERAAGLALLADLRDDPAPAARAVELLAGYEERYFALPNRDNVLGPSHLFFSTYLESLWINSLLAAATTLRAAGRLPAERVEGINRIADEAANLIGEFNEGLSNRQTWHAAALAGIAVWFEDAELLATAVESRNGLLGHLADGFGADGMWWEGENYHLFALRGLLQGIRWANVMGFDMLEDPEVRDHFRSALLAPATSALPDFTYPARHDSRYGVSLAHPASLEIWEIGRVFLGEDDELEAWLTALYRVPHPSLGEGYDAWLNDAGLPPPESRQRIDLSWWVAPAIPLGPPRELEWNPGSILLPDQGVAVLRHEQSYASLECGPAVPGHGHPSHLHLTLHADGLHWLPDPGTGAYVHDTLAWYRSALAHNAPLFGGVNAGGAEAWCAGFDTVPPWAWARGRAGDLTRTVILGPGHLVDLLELDSAEARELVLPWHFRGELKPPGEAGSAGVRTLQVTDPAAHRSLQVFFLAPGADLTRAQGPGLPGETGEREFLSLQAVTPRAAWLTVIDLAPSDDPAAVTDIAMEGETIRISTRGGIVDIRRGPEGVSIEAAGSTTKLGGLRPRPKPHRPLFQERLEQEVVAVVRRIPTPPSLDGSLDGFDLSDPLVLDSEHQYRRSEEPYDPERFSAEAWINWDGDALYLAIQVRKPELIFRPTDAPPLNLDNEPEDINSDGLQVYLAQEGRVAAALIVPQESGPLAVRPIGAEGLGVQGTWSPDPEGYTITVSLAHPLVSGSWADRLRFDLLVNEMREGRVRRAGQLAWSGGEGWIYLRGDRQNPAGFGGLILG